MVTPRANKPVARLVEVEALPINLQQIHSLAEWPSLHSDPFARILIVQERSEESTIVSWGQRHEEIPDGGAVEMNLDQLITVFDNSLRTILVTPQASRANPAKEAEETALSETEKRDVVGLMRVNHVGEVCAQALYQGQALTAKNPVVRIELEKAARDENDHLAWCEFRINELGGRKSLLNPFWYSASFALGAVAGALGDRWNLGFLAETEKQVEAHLDTHLAQLPMQDQKSRAIVQQMKEDESRHAQTAIAHGGMPLPLLVKGAMKLASRVMKKTAYYL